MSLVEIETGSSCRVVNLKATDKMLQKLLDMGFTKNAQIDVIREAPLYDPMELRIQNYTIALRKSEAMLVEVERL